MDSGALETFRNLHSRNGIMSSKLLPAYVCLVGCFLTMASAASAQEVFADWTSLTTFEIGSITAVASTSNQVNAADVLLTTTATQDGFTNYPDVWFTPTPPVGILWSGGVIGNATLGSEGSNDITVDFSEPVFNPRFHFINLDNATVTFTGSSVQRLSGNTFFEVTGEVVNSTTVGGPNPGCADDLGGNPLGACGTVELLGTFTSVTFTAADQSITTTGSGDGFLWTMSADANAAALAIPTASEWGLILLGFLIVGAALVTLRRATFLGA